MLINKSIKVLLFTLLTLCVFSCKSNQSKPLPDVSDINVDVKIQHFERDLFALTPDNFEAQHSKLLSEYPNFYPFFCNTLMEWGKIDSLEKEVLQFVQHPDIAGVYDTVAQKYSAMETIEDDLVTAFKYAKHYLPNTPIPQKVVTYLSAFRQMVLTLDNDLLGVGLDMHLGEDYPFYPSTGYPKYQIQTFTPEHLPAHAMHVWAKQIHPEPPAVRSMLEEMVYKGKLLYFLDLVLPYTPDYIKMGYTESQEEWCRNNASQIWAFFIERKLLYQKESSKYVYFTEPGPSSMGMPQEAPGNVASWMGWQIVRKFMKENPKVTVEELFAIHDGQEILKRAKYKP